MSETPSVIGLLVAAQATIAARQAVVHDRPDFDSDARMWASRLCSRQLEALESAILLEPPTAATDLRLIALTAISKLSTLEGKLDDAGANKLLPIVEQLSVALEHIVAHPLLGGTDDSPDRDDLQICRAHVASRAVPLVADASQQREA